MKIHKTFLFIVYFSSFIMNLFGKEENYGTISFNSQSLITPITPFLDLEALISLRTSSSSLFTLVMPYIKKVMESRFFLFIFTSYGKKTGHERPRKKLNSLIAFSNTYQILLNLKFLNKIKKENLLESSNELITHRFLLSLVKEIKPVLSKAKYIKGIHFTHFSLEKINFLLLNLSDSLPLIEYFGASSLQLDLPQNSSVQSSFFPKALWGHLKNAIFPLNPKKETPSLLLPLLQSIPNFSHLTSLNLSDNAAVFLKEGKENFIYFSEGIRNLFYLKELNISGCLRQQEFHEIFWPCLSALKLKKLITKDNNLKERNISIIFTGHLIKMTTLEILDISHNTIYEFFPEIASSISHLNQLTALYFSNNWKNNIDPHCFFALRNINILCQLLKNLSKSLKILDLSNNKIPSQNWSIFLTGISQLNVLKKLNLSVLPFKKELKIPIFNQDNNIPYVSQGLIPLTSLDLSSSSYSALETSQLFSLLINCLRILNLSENDMFYKPQLVKTLKKFLYLEELNFSSNSPYCHGVSSLLQLEKHRQTTEILADSLAHLSYLVKLDLHNNNFNDNDLCILTRLPRGLTYLDLSANSFNHIEKFLLNFPLMPYLTYFNFQFPQMPAKGFEILSKLSPQLKYFNLSKNKFNVNDLYQHREAFKNLTDLNHLIFDILIFDLSPSKNDMLLFNRFLSFLDNFSLTFTLNFKTVDGYLFYREAIRSCLKY